MSLAIGVGCVHAARELHNNLLSRTMRLPMSFFDCTPLGRIINRFSKDVDVVDNMIPQILRLWFLMIFNVSKILKFLANVASSIISVLTVGRCNFCGYQHIYADIRGCHRAYPNCVLLHPKLLCSNLATIETY